LRSGLGAASLHDEVRHEAASPDLRAGRWPNNERPRDVTHPAENLRLQHVLIDRVSREPAAALTIRRARAFARDELTRVNARPSDGISAGVVNLRQVSRLAGDVPVPLGIAELSNGHAHLIKACVTSVAKLDNDIRRGFKQLFSSDPCMAATLVRRAFNSAPGENPFLEALISTLTADPSLCEQKTILYRIDGLDGGDRIVVNEVNANPIGAFWLGRLHLKEHPDKDAFGIDRLPRLYAERIKRHTSPASAYFLPVRSLDSSSSYSEKIILKNAIADLGIDIFMAPPQALLFTEQGVHVAWAGKQYRIGYIGGLSSPEVFMKVPALLNHVAARRVHCPSAIDNIIGLASKGIFTLVTDMREGRLDPALLGLSCSDVAAGNAIPSTYWLYDRAAGVDNTAIFLNRSMVAKPHDGVGGKQIIFSKDADTLRSLSLPEKCVFLIQDYYPSFQVVGTSATASLDPYFINDAQAAITGVLVRTAPEGFLPNLTANAKRPDFTTNAPRNLFCLGVHL
jgi:hypothetical protein